jgi:hypothetical protein
MIFLLRKLFQESRERKYAEILPYVFQRPEDVAELIYQKVLMHQKNYFTMLPGKREQEKEEQ